MIEITNTKAIELNGKYLNVSDVADILGVSYSAILKRINAGKIDGSQNHPILIPFKYVEEAIRDIKNNQ